MKRLAMLAVVSAIGCGAPCLDSQPDGTHVRFDDPEAGLEGFVSHPWPSDALLRGRSLELRHFPNPTESSTLDDYLEIITFGTEAFGTTSAYYLGFSAGVDEGSLPADRTGALAANASIFLLEIDPDSPERGRRFPLRVRYSAAPSLYLEANHLILLPPYGVQLAGGTTYALVVTNRVTSGGEPIVASQHAHNALYDACEETTPSKIFSAFADLRRYFEDDGDVDPDDIAAAAVFTTQDAVAELRELAALAREQPALVPAEWASGEHHPRRWRYDAVVDLPGYQDGDIPYETLGDGGEFARDGDGRFTIDHYERARLGFSIPRVQTMPSAGWPVVLYSHGTGGSYESMFDSEVARLLAQRGIAAVGYDQTLHGPRAPPGTDPNITFFNIFNPVAARDNVRQGAADAVVLTSMIEGLRIPASVTEDGVEVRFDPKRIGFIGHSQGGLVGAGFAAIDERPKAFLFSGTAGILAITFLERKDFFDFKGRARDGARAPGGRGPGRVPPGPESDPDLHRSRGPDRLRTELPRRSAEGREPRLPARRGLPRLRVAGARPGGVRRGGAVPDRAADAPHPRRRGVHRSGAGVGRGHRERRDERGPGHRGADPVSGGDALPDLRQPGRAPALPGVHTQLAAGRSRQDPGGRVIATSARVVHVLTLSLWLGASIFFMAVAPTLFEVVSSRHEAAEFLTAALHLIDWFGLVAGPVLLVTLFTGWVPLQVPLRLRALVTIGMTVAVAASGQWVTPRLSELMAAMGRPLQDMDPAHETMVEYAQLHDVSSGLMLIHVAGALLLVVTAVLASRPKQRFGIEL